MVDEQEEWRTSRLQNGLLVSSLGRLRGARGHIKKMHVSDRGYLRAWVGTKTERVHRVVADAFIGPIPPGMTVNHIDGNKMNNRVSNLEIVTQADNIRHALATGLKRRAPLTGRPNPYAQGEKNHDAKLKAEQVLAIRRRVASGERMVDLALEFGVAPCSISNIVARRTWRHL